MERAVGALVGWVVGDALGAPFEFGAPDRFSARFPDSVLLDPSEMVGNSLWQPAEWTDDTQMGLLVAESLLDRAGIDEADLFARFVDWLHGRPRDIGNQTRAVLSSAQPWNEAAEQHFRRTRHAAGNGSLMRTIPAALFFAGTGLDATVDAAARISALTHGDPTAGVGCAIYHELVSVALAGDDPLDAVDVALDRVAPELRQEWGERLRPDYDPRRDTVANGAVWPTLGSALWALRTTRSFEDALRAAIDLGGDTDTVACVTGGLAGAVYSVGAIPSRWTTYLHGELVGRGDSGFDLAGLQTLARDLVTGRRVPSSPLPADHVVEPTRVDDALPLYAASYPGVAAAHAAGRLPTDALLVSLSRIEQAVSIHRPRRQVWMVDQSGSDVNLALAAALKDVVDTCRAALSNGTPVIVHCHGGRSRTGLVLRALLVAEHPDWSLDQVDATVSRRWSHSDTWNTSFTAALELARLSWKT